MKKIDRIMLDLLDVEGLNTTKIEVSPGLEVHVNNFLLDQNKERIVSYCKGIPENDLTGINLFKMHTNQDRFLGLMLMAIGEHYKVWDRFPSVKLPWNLPHFPCAVLPPKDKKIKHLQYKSDVEEESTED